MLRKHFKYKTISAITNKNKIMTLRTHNDKTNNVHYVFNKLEKTNA